MDMGLKGKTAVVTASSLGLGKAMALGLAQEGANVTICARRNEHLQTTKNEIENRLEQLRALDNNIDINVSLAKSSPIGVDTEEDYLALKKIMEYKN